MSPKARAQALGAASTEALAAKRAAHVAFDAAKQALDAANDAYIAACSEEADWKRWTTASKENRDTVLAMTEEQLSPFRRDSIYKVDRIALRHAQWATEIGLIKVTRGCTEFTIAGECARVLAFRGREWVSA